MPTPAKPQRGKKRSRRVDVYVSLEKIVESESRSSSHCMIAEAVKEAVPEAQNVAVDLQTIRWSDPITRRRYIYLTPRVAQVALVKFDQGEHSEPFSFQLKGAHSLAMGLSSAQRKAGKKPKDNKQRMVGGDNGMVPEKRGGKSPPLAALAHGDNVRGGRRSFGLRKLTY